MPPWASPTATLALSRNTNGGSTSAARTTIRTAASSGICSADRRALAKQVIIDLLPLGHPVLGLLGSEEARAELAFVRLERRRQCRHGGVGRQILGGAEN